MTFHEWSRIQTSKRNMNYCTVHWSPFLALSSSQVAFLLQLSLSMPPPPPKVVRCQINCYLHHPYFSTLSLMILCVCALLCRQFQPILFRANSGSTSLIYYDCHSNWSTIFHSSDNRKIKCSYVHTRRPGNPTLPGVTLPASSTPLNSKLTSTLANPNPS